MLAYLKDIVQIMFWLTGIVFTVVSIISVIKAIRQYRRNAQQRMAESLIELEERLQKCWDIMRLIDPASQRYDAELRPAVQHSLDNVPQENRKYADRKLILELDQFLRFLLLLSSLEKHELLDREALEYMYKYWFDTVYNQHGLHLRMYIVKYFPTLNNWLSERFASQ